VIYFNWLDNPIETKPAEPEESVKEKGPILSRMNKVSFLSYPQPSNPKHR
jgi:hypothetical protein